MASAEVLHPDTYVMKWAQKHGGYEHNQISRSLTSHSYLFRLNRTGGWLTDYEKKLLEEYNEVDVVNACPACSVGRIRGLDHNLFSQLKHVSLIKLLQFLGITRHQFSLATMVLLTQNNKGHLSLTHEQQQEAQNWLIKEGQQAEETHNSEKGVKAEIVKHLHQLEMYQTLIPPSVSEDLIDHSLLLGGTIQQMQMRFIGMIAYYDNYDMPEHLDGSRPSQSISRTMGKLTALTCHRIINAGKQLQQEVEIDEKHETMWFEVGNDGKVDYSYNESTHFSNLTEDTAYRAIVHAVRRMCDDQTFFERHYRTENENGFHPKSYAPDDGLTSYLYQYNGKDFAYELTEKFREASCRFLEEHSYHPNTLAPIDLSPNKRPTTKETVKDWVQRTSPCKFKDDPTCNIQVFSSQPYARYQQLAVLQGVEEEIESLHPTKIRVSISAIGASTKIPTDAALDNLSRTMFMIQRRPER